MKYLLLLFLFMPGGTDPATVSKINALKADAREAYAKGDYKKAAITCQYLIDSLDVDEDEVKLNLANALFELNDSTAADRYGALTSSLVPSIRSRSDLQLGVIENRKNDFNPALAHFKEALKADPRNEDARYNYEMLKKKLDEKKDQQKQQKDQTNKDDQKKQDQQQQQKNQQGNNKDQQQKNQQDKEKQDNQDKQQQSQNAQKGQPDQQQSAKDNQKEMDKQNLADKLKEMNMSEEKAKMILDAMKNQEIQYLQQATHKSKAPKDNGKPDW